MFRHATTLVCVSLLTIFTLTAGCNDAGVSGSNEADNNRLPLLSVGETPARPVTNFNSSEPTEAEPTPVDAPHEAGPTPAAAPDAEITPAEAELAQALQLWQKSEAEGVAPAARRNHLNELVERTSRAIALTRGHVEEADVLNLSAVTRANARVQLALMDDADFNDDANTQADLLANDADELFRYDATSMAATETAYRLVELARELAERHSHEDNPEWANRYSRQARLFAQRFPLEGHRASLGLMSAAENCEQAGAFDEARQCYTVLTTSYDDSLPAIQAERALRRMNLEGPLVGFAGETLDGGQIDVADLQGDTVLIVFWKSDSQEFIDQFDELVMWKQLYGDNLQIVGVNLDAEETAVRDFVETRGFPGQVIFFSDPLLRGDGNPLAMYYAVNVVPSYWLIDADGAVTSTSCDFDDLNAVFITAGLGQPFGTAPR